MEEKEKEKEAEKKKPKTQKPLLTLHSFFGKK